jgi:hypothetical protein
MTNAVNMKLMCYINAVNMKLMYYIKYSNGLTNVQTFEIFFYILIIKQLFSVPAVCE